MPVSVGEGVGVLRTLMAPPVSTPGSVLSCAPWTCPQREEQQGFCGRGGGAGQEGRLQADHLPAEREPQRPLDPGTVAAGRRPARMASRRERLAHPNWGQGGEAAVNIWKDLGAVTVPPGTLLFLSPDLELPPSLQNFLET